jgi:cytochrome c553
MSLAKHCAIGAALVALALISTPSGATSTPPAFKSANVNLPFGDQMFEGADADAINNNCLACHSADMVLNQPPLPRPSWQAEVEKMRAVYKAPIQDADVQSIVDYLVQIKGAK